MSRLEVRLNDYLTMGVGTVWVLDPETRQSTPPPLPRACAK